MAFERIALCLSGGGYRAAAFHLGALRALDELQLLNRLRCLSTISGGTIVGAELCGALVNKESFSIFFERFKKFLSTVNVVDQAFDKLHSSESRCLSLIRAAASVYDTELCNGKSFGDLVASDIPIQDIVFSATEFRHGLAFRVQRTRDQRGVFGNGKLRVPESVANKIRLADIVAASSCFPGAFEPINFPDDFYWPKGCTLTSIRRELGGDFPTSVPLMDGGIYDNQGVDAAEMAGGGNHTDYDLFIISDTNQRTEQFLATTTVKRHGWITLRVWAWLTMVLCGVSGLSTIFLSKFIYEQWNSISLFNLCTLGIIPALCSGTITCILVRIFLLFKSTQAIRVSGVDFDLWPMLRRLTLPELLQLVRHRLEAILPMISVFMKRIRALTFNKLFDDPKYKGKIASNLIYELAGPHNALYQNASYLKPSQQLQDLSKEAEASPTTLWIASTDELESLIRCGRVTMLFSLLKTMEEHPDSNIRESDVYIKAKELWNKANS